MPGQQRARIIAAMQQLAWALVLLVNLTTVLVYGWDKLQSRRPGRRRVSERSLLWLVFATGWIGAWLAMGWFRHKTQKTSFRRLALLWTVLNPFWLLLAWTWSTRAM